MGTLEDVWHRYSHKKCLDSFLSESYAWMVGYTRSRLNDDPDICQDFLVQFIEKVPRFLHYYGNSDGKRFTGFLARCMRYDFMNFIRKRRRYAEQMLSIPVEVLPQEEYAGSRDHRLPRLLEDIKPSRRVLLKLQSGWSLELSDLRYLCRKYGAAPTKELWNVFEARRRRQENRALEHTRQMSSYYDRIQRGIGTRDYRSIRRKKERYRITSTRNVLSLREIGQILNASKAGLHRQLARGRSELRAGLENPTMEKTHRPAVLATGMLGGREPSVLYEFRHLENRSFLVLETTKNLESTGISLYTPERICYKLGLSEAVVLPLHLLPPGRYALEARGHKLGFKLTV